MTDEELPIARIRQLARLARRILAKSRFRSKEAYEKKFARRLVKESYQPGDSVLIRDVAPEKGVSLDKKIQNRYMGPYEETRGGSCRLKELNGVPPCRTSGGCIHVDSVRRTAPIKK